MTDNWPPSAETLADWADEMALSHGEMGCPRNCEHDQVAAFLRDPRLREALELAAMMTAEESAMLRASGRCVCGHLSKLHNAHCCAFCVVDDCPCELWV